MTKTWGTRQLDCEAKEGRYFHTANREGTLVIIARSGQRGTNEIPKKNGDDAAGEARGTPTRHSRLD
jgi:hypothetical protein